MLSADEPGTFLPVGINAVSDSGPTRQFALVIDEAVGLAPKTTLGDRYQFNVGAAPRDAVIVDLNGDGKPDIAISNHDDNTISVLLNVSTPGAVVPAFSSQVTFSVTGAEAIVSADINGDGKADLIIISNGVTVLLNTTTLGASTPTFSSPKSFTVGSGANSIAVLDVNADGKPDLAVANVFDATVSVLINATSTGASVANFATQETFPAGKDASSIAGGDFNGDGRADLAVVNAIDGTVSVLLNTTAPGGATPAFAPQQVFATGNNPQSVAVADLDNDGRPDLIVGNYSDSTVSILRNTTPLGAALPTFALEGTFATGQFPRSVKTLDLNGDGRLDIVVAAQAADSISVLTNVTGQGSTSIKLLPHQEVLAGTAPWGLAVGDLNTDGKPDVVAVDVTEDRISVLLNATQDPTGGVAFAAPSGFVGGASAHQLTTADLDGDGKDDLIVANYQNDTVTVLLNRTAPGALVASYAAPRTFGTGSFPYGAVAADINGDGRLDVIAANHYDGTISVLINATAPGAEVPSFLDQQTFVAGDIIAPIGLEPFTLEAADFNGDGRPDIAIAEYGYDRVSVLLNTTTPGSTTASFAAPLSWAAGGSEPYAVTTIDFDGDGRPDLAVAELVSGGVSIFLNTTPAGASAPSFASRIPIDVPEPMSLAVADFNGDGRPDLAVGSYGGAVSIIFDTAPVGLPPTFQIATAAQLNTVVAIWAADIDGDGRPDIFAADAGYTVSMLHNTTVNGSFLPSFDAHPIANTAGPPLATPIWGVASDLNGDGRPDVVFVNEDGTGAVLFNQQYRVSIVGNPAVGTIVHDAIFQSGFD